MSQEWILEEVLKSDEYNDDPDRLRATIIDSATGDDWHKERAARAKEAVSDAIEQSDEIEDDVEVSFDGPQLITEGLPDPWKSERLTDPVEIRDLFDTQRLNSWWLQQGREPLSKIEREGFGGGVWRRRSMSKALYHVSEHTEQDVAPNTDADDEVVIVAALGGGTGSGMVLDIAADLPSERTHLFAILPHSSDNASVKANAHAALSELEYAHLTGDSPFSTITLIPHLESLDDKDRDFEMAVVRSILAHQNGVQQGNFTEDIIPGSPVGPQDYAPFTLAMPYTVRYDVQMRRIAEEELENKLAAKRKELERESDLYTVVEKYLEESFPESAGAVFRDDGTETGNLDTDDGREEAYQLRERIEEDVRDTFLEQSAFRVAGLGDELEEIHKVLDEILDDEQNLGINSMNSMEQAREFISTAPGMLRNQLEDHFDYEETDGHLYTLIEVLKQEFDNIERRARLWGAIALLTADKTEGVDEQTAADIRKALRDGVLSPDVTFLNRVLTNPTIDNRIEELRAKRNQRKERRDSLETFYSTVATDVQEMLDSWQGTVSDEAAVLAAINRNQETVEEALDELGSQIIGGTGGAIARVEGSGTASAVEGTNLNLSNKSLESIDGGLTELNRLLSEMDVDKIDGDAVKNGFEYVKAARKDTHKHRKGRFGIGGNDRSDEFLQNAGAANDSGWFQINKTRDGLDVTDPFSCDFADEKLDRTAAISKRKQQAINAIVDALEGTLTDNGELVSYSHEETGQTGADKVTVPTSDRTNDLTDELRALVEASDAEDGERLLESVLPYSQLDPETPTAEFDLESTKVMDILLEEYLQPIGTAHKQASKQYDDLDREKTGLIHRFEALYGLSAGPSQDNVSVALPKAHRLDDREETYGRTFANRYEGIYEIPLPQEADVTDGTHPFVKHEESEPEDLIDADHIGESRILENHIDRITQDFANSLRALQNNKHGRVPLNDLFPQGSADSAEVGGRYTAIRYRSIYMSRALDHADSLTSKYDNVHEQIKDITLNETDNDVYRAETYDSGGPDDITMTLFIGGVFLDNIELLTRRGGYKDKYDEKFGSHEFIGTHHTIGLGARWNRWDAMEADAHEGAVAQETEFNDYGAYVYRDEVRGVDGKFIDEIMIADNDETKDAKDVFLDMLSVNAYESTISKDS
ncbi:tubulin-like doman-containing protein [Salinigranum halophilum]|uniref:tubulin-like doman-containing protein n=1 Tax=Salinigranum halophilum TaxID=2565931 RepID=UPI001F376B73